MEIVIFFAVARAGVSAGPHRTSGQDGRRRNRKETLYITE